MHVEEIRMDRLNLDPQTKIEEDVSQPQKSSQRSSKDMEMKICNILE